MTFTLIVLAAILVAGAGLFMTDIRDAVVFKPRRARAEAAVLDIAAREAAQHRGRGKFDTFTPSEAPVHLRRMGMSLADWPSEDFLLDATLMPSKNLRIRALPRPEAVQALRVGAQMYVTEVAPAGGVRQSGWYP